MGRGTWGLKEWYPGRSFKKDKEGKGPSEVEEKAAAAIRESIKEEEEVAEQAPRVVREFEARKKKASGSE